jgi:hypothetical protein
MNNTLKNWIAQAESWQCAVELNTPTNRLARYNVLDRVDDLYICSFSAIFKAFRVEDEQERAHLLLDLAKSLHLFSEKVSRDLLGGVEHDLNQLYVAALYYLAGYPATAVLVGRRIDNTTLDAENEIEGVLRYFLQRKSPDEGNSLVNLTVSFIQSGNERYLDELDAALNEAVVFGLSSDPRLFIAAKLAVRCIEQFRDTNIWSVLRANVADFNIEEWQPLIASYTRSNAPIWDIFPSQRGALEAGLIGSEGTVSLQMPTSAGKTALCELLIYHEVRALDNKVLFLVPFRALAAEIKEGLVKRLKALDITISASYGGNIPSTTERGEVSTADVLIVTPEKYQALDQALDNFSDRFSIVICDEGHLIDDDNRGLSYELLLTKLRADTTNPKRFVFLSAILPNVIDLHQWLNGQAEGLAESNYKPVETECALLALNGANYQLEVNPTHEIPKKYYVPDVLSREDFRFINPESGRWKTLNGWDGIASIACRMALKTRHAGAVAIFTATKGRNGVRGIANKLVLMLQSLPLPITQRSTDLDLVIDFIKTLFGTDHQLAKVMEYGTIFHHGDLPQEVRRAVEDAINKKMVDVIICTSTLAEGVNLPIRTLIIHCTGFRTGPDPDDIFQIKQRSLKNIIGRAGRAGKETKGRVIFANPKDHDRARDLANDLNMEPARGFLIKLIDVVNKYQTEHGGIALTNELFDNGSAYIKGTIDHIDRALIDLLPDDIENLTDQVLTDMVENTLAYQLCNTQELKDCLLSVFTIRKERLEGINETIPVSTLRKSGSVPRFVEFVTSREITDHPLWLVLENSLNPQWIDEVILPLLEYPLFEEDIDPDVCRRLIVNWIGGATYAECAADIGVDVDEVLPLFQRVIWFKLQSYAGQVSKLSKIKHGALPELAERWPSLLQFGVSNLQQLEMMERGLTDRLSVHCISRWLDDHGHEEHGGTLRLILMQNQTEILQYLRSDERVPEYSVKLTEIELFNLWR